MNNEKRKKELLIRALKGRADVLLLIGAHQNALSDCNKIKSIKKDIKTKIYVLIKLSIIYDKMGDPANAKELAEKVYKILFFFFTSYQKFIKKLIFRAKKSIMKASKKKILIINKRYSRIVPGNS